MSRIVELAVHQIEGTERSWLCCVMASVGCGAGHHCGGVEHGKVMCHVKLLIECCGDRRVCVAVTHLGRFSVNCSMWERTGQCRRMLWTINTLSWHGCPSDNLVCQCVRRIGKTLTVGAVVRLIGSAFASRMHVERDWWLRGPTEALFGPC